MRVQPASASRSEVRESFYRPRVAVGRVVVHRGCGGELVEVSRWPERPGEESWRGFVCRKCGRRVIELSELLSVAVRAKGRFSISSCDLARALVEAGVGEWQEVEYVEREHAGVLVEVKTAKRRMRCRYCGREIERGEAYGIVRFYAGYSASGGHAYIGRRAVCSDCMELSRALASQPRPPHHWSCSREWPDGWWSD